jgi:hypothetical protein
MNNLWMIPGLAIFLVILPWLPLPTRRFAPIFKRCQLFDRARHFEVIPNWRPSY